MVILVIWIASTVEILILLSIDVGKTMDASISEVEASLRPHLDQFGQRKDNTAPGTIFDTLDSQRFAERKSL